MVEFIGALSNLETQERLERLSTKLSQIEAEGATPRPTTTARSLRVGAVPDAIMQVLADTVEPMRMRDIHTEVEVLIGQPVSRSAVKNWLANNARHDDAPLIRLGRGRYLLANEGDHGGSRPR